MWRLEGFSFNQRIVCLYKIQHFLSTVSFLWQDERNFQESVIVIRIGDAVTIKTILTELWV